MTRPLVRAIDHFVLTCGDVEATVAFYERALGMKGETFAGGRRALSFGNQKINLHQAGAEFEPRATRPVPGAGDFCLLADVPVAEIAEHLATMGIEVIEGPVAKTGATGPLTSIYFRDPDGNLVEVANPA
ncbi:MAG TPA: VOC family protein [Thermohalobaculum sp.]|nr:VOC family protein [Thermohalobaculum sp.]